LCLDVDRDNDVRNHSAHLPDMEGGWYTRMCRGEVERVWPKWGWMGRNGTPKGHATQDDGRSFVGEKIG